MIPLSVPHIKGNEWKYVKECLDTEWVSSVGKYVDMFEKNIAGYVGSPHAVACVNGTAALQIALLLAGVKTGEEVIVPTVTFIAPVNAVRYLNANPVFMDCDQYYNIDTEKVLQFLESETVSKKDGTYNKTTGKRIAAIIPVHVFGNAVNLHNLAEVCNQRSIKVVEDAAESIGTFYTDTPLKGKFTGTVGDFGCYSFNGNKIITTGGGGMILTADKDAAQKAKYLTTQAKDHPVYYIHDEIGYNFRLTNLQAALGVAQLEKLEEYIRIKTSNYQKFKTEIEDIPGLHLAETPTYARSNYWFYCLQIDIATYGKNRDELMQYLSENGIQTRPIWHLNHLQNPHKHFQNYKIENAQEMFEKTLNIPCSVNLSNEQITFIIKKLQDGKK